jgi:hypothetical protein
MSLSSCIPNQGKRNSTASSTKTPVSDASRNQPGNFVGLPVQITDGESIPVEFRFSESFLAQIRNSLEMPKIQSHATEQDVKITSRNILCEVQVSAGDRMYYRSRMSVTPETLPILRTLRETATIRDSGEPPPMPGTSLWVRVTITLFCETDGGEAISEVLLSKGKAVRFVERKSLPVVVTPEEEVDPVSFRGLIQTLRSLHPASLRLGFLVGAAFVLIIAILLKLLTMVRSVGAPGIALQGEDGTTFVTANAIRDLTRSEFEDFPALELLRFRLAKKRRNVWIRLDVAFDIAGGSFPEHTARLREQLLMAFRDKLGIGCPTEIDIQLRKGGTRPTADSDSL